MKTKEKVIAAICVIMTTFHLIANIVSIEAMVMRAVHLGFVLVLIFLCYPAKPKRIKGKSLEDTEPALQKLTIVDGVLIALSLAAVGYLLINYNYFVTRITYVTPLKIWDKIFAISLVAIILIATRRTVGWSLTIVALVFIAYAFLGKYLPGILRHGGIKLDVMVDDLYMSTNGIFSSTLGMSATYIMLFIIFGAMLTEAGIGELFSKLANALTKNLKSGPAAAAVVSSAMFGTVSGSATANVYTTGTFTIPMMKKAGYEPHFAGAVEAVASCGGQITPPVLGATAFVMADLAGLPYGTICLAAILPCALYYISLMVSVQARAYKNNLQSVPFAEGDGALACLKELGHLFIPIVVLVVLMALKFSTMYSVFIAIVTILPVSWMRKSTRLTPKKLLKVFESSAKNVLTVAIACAVAGIVQATIVSSGIGFKFVSLILEISGNSVMLALVAVALVCLLLGMGMPTTASYVLVAALASTALLRMGLTMIQTHMFIFYFATLSAITPPVALAAYAGASIAKAPIMKTGWTAAKLGLVVFILPFCFISEPSILLVGDIRNIVQTVIATIIAASALALGCEGYTFGKMGVVERILLIVVAVVCLFTTGIMEFAAAALCLGYIVVRYVAARRKPSKTSA